MTPEQAGTAAAAAARVAGKALEDTKEEPSLHHGSALQNAERCDEIVVAAGAEFCCCQCSGSCSRSSGRGMPGAISQRKCDGLSVAQSYFGVLHVRPGCFD